MFLTTLTVTVTVTVAVTVAVVVVVVVGGGGGGVVFVVVVVVVAVVVMSLSLSLSLFLFLSLCLSLLLLLVVAGGEGVDSVRGRNSQEETVGKHTMGDPCNGDKLIPPLIWNPESFFFWYAKCYPIGLMKLPYHKEPMRVWTPLGGSSHDL